MLSAVNNQAINQRKRSIIQANYSGKSEEEEENVGEEDVLIHSVSCEFADDDDDNAAEGLRRRKKKKQRHEDERGDDMTEDDVVAAPPSSSSSSSQTKKEQHQRSASPPPSVVPLSMQLFRPFWSLSCCPDCNVNPMGNHHRRRMQQDDAFLMDGGSPPSIGGGGGGVLDTRLRSVSMTSLKGIGISSSSASSTITSGVKLSNHPDHFKSSTEEDDDEEEDDDDDENDGVATSVAHASFLPSSSSSLESTKHSPSPSSSDVLLDAILPNRMSTGLGGLRNDDPRRLLITPTLSTTVNTTATSSSSAAALANTVTIEQLLHEYTTACTIYGCHNRINPGVLTTLRYQLPTLRVSGNFFDADMLALSEILLRHCNGALKYITRLDFSIAAKEGKSSSFGGGSGNGKRGFRSHGAYALAKVLGMSEYIEEVYLMGNHVGPFGASAIFTSIGKNERTVLKTLLMRGCRIGERGALSFVTDILERNTPKTTKDDADGKMKEIVLEEVDFSANRIGFHGCYEIERALLKSSTTNTSSSFSTAATATSSSSSTTNTTTTTTTVWTPSGVKISASAHSLHVDLEANLVFQEVMNCITHGLGIVLAIIGSILLSTQVNDKPTHYINSCAIYSTSLIVLFSCSTLYHSFFALNRTRFIFRVFDRCAIYMLIGGSYSPLLNIALQKHEYTKLLWFIYTCGSCGIVTEATLWKWKHKPKFSLAMYMGMGWSCLVCLPDLIEALPIEGVWLLALGGVAYTSGVPFFVRNTNLDHSIWHMFVLVGSVLHWLCVYLYVARLPIVE